MRNTCESQDRTKNESQIKPVRAFSPDSARWRSAGNRSREPTLSSGGIICYLEKLCCPDLSFPSHSRCARMRRVSDVFALCIKLLTIGFSKLQMGLLRE